MSINNTPLSNQTERNMHDLVMLERVTFPHPQHTRIIVIANQKDSVSKTTSAVNLTASLAMGGLLVLIVDADAQGNALSTFGVPHPAETPSTYGAIIGGASVTDVVQPCPDIDGIVVCPATIDLSSAEVELADVERREYRLRKALREYVSEHVDIDIVLINCPPSLDLMTLNVMATADEVMIPIQAEYYALKGLSQLWNAIERVGIDLNPDLRVSGVLLTMADRRTRLSEEVESEVRLHFPNHTFETVIPRSVRISEAPSCGQAVATYDPRDVGAIAYRKAALELCRRVAAPEE